MNSQAKTHNLNDWLTLHQVSANDLNHLIGTLPTYTSAIDQTAPAQPDKQPTLNAEQAWALAAQALCALFPEQHTAIHATQQRCKRHFNSHVTRPHTQADDPPQVFINYQGRIADILAVAHEFGHALQSITSPSRFTPPILRELAAFISELALLNYTEQTTSPFAGTLYQAWQQDNHHYLHDDLHTLQNSLQDTHSPYQYCWNYPIARHLASQLVQHAITRSQIDTLWQAIIGELSLMQCIEATTDKPTGLRLENHLPAVPEPDKQQPAINAYRALGMMLLLDIEYWQGPVEKTIADYYQVLLEPMQAQSAHIAINDNNKPIGYVTWHVNTNTQAIQATRQAAPFGDHIQLHKSWQRRLPDATVNVTSLHLNSARKEQAVW